MYLNTVKLNVNMLIHPSTCKKYENIFGNLKFISLFLYLYDRFLFSLFICEDTQFSPDSIFLTFFFTVLLLIVIGKLHLYLPDRSLSFM